MRQPDMADNLTPIRPLTPEQRDAILAGFAGFASTGAHVGVPHEPQSELKAA